MATVVVAGTLDTKGREIAFVVDSVREAGADPYVIDIGVLDAPGDHGVRPDVTAAQVARLGGSDLADLRAGGESGEARAAALDVMCRGLVAALQDLAAQGRCQAVLGLGGSSGTSMVAGAVQELPVGVPKLIVSTMASGEVSPYVGTRDVCLMYSVVDIAGLNRISRVVLRNAANAAAGMAAGAGSGGGEEGRPLVAISMFGVTTPCVLRVQEQLESRGFETTVFHATGSGGRAMETLIDDGLIEAVVDLTTSELTDELVGGVLSAGPDRLEAAGRRGVPQVAVPGALEVINWGPKDTVPEAHRVPERRMHVHNPSVTVTRTNLDESRQLGRIFADKLRKATGPVTVLLPLRGLSALDAPGQPYEDQEADQALFAEIKQGLGSAVQVCDVDVAINDPQFADAVVAEFERLWATRG